MIVKLPTYIFIIGLEEGVDSTSLVSGREVMVLLRGRVGVWGTSNRAEDWLWEAGVVLSALFESFSTIAVITLLLYFGNKINSMNCLSKFRVCTFTILKYFRNLTMIKYDNQSELFVLKWWC